MNTPQHVIPNVPHSPITPQLPQADATEGADVPTTSSIDRPKDAINEQRAVPVTHKIRGNQIQFYENVANSNRKLPLIPGYQVILCLGEGGMGVVYKAIQQRLNRVCAIKMLHINGQSNSEGLTRFLNEAQVIGQITHPNIVQIYNFGEVDGIMYLELEYVEGRSLDQLLDGNPRAPEVAARLTETLARAIQIFHEMNIVHRDLKPANILMKDDQVPKITDFGLAKRLDSVNRVTQTGELLGTPDYMAPEQATGNQDAIGPATDVYALGVILYELITGRRPFVGVSIPDVLMNIVASDPIAPRSLNPRLPRDLETICMKCLEKVPSSRYESALDLAEDLARFGRRETIRAHPTPVWEKAWRWCKRNPLAASSLSGLALVLTFAMMLVFYGYREAVDNRLAAEVFEAKAKLQSAVLEMEKGLELAQEGKITEGLDWMAQGLVTLPVDAREPVAAEVRRMEPVLLENIAGWSLRTAPLVTAIALPAPARHLLHFDPEDQPSPPVSDGKADENADAQNPRIPMLIAGCQNGDVLIFNAETYANVTPVIHHGAALENLALSPDGSMLVTAGNKRIQCWSLPDGRPVDQPITTDVDRPHIVFSRDPPILFVQISKTKILSRKIPLFPAFSAAINMPSEMELMSLANKSLLTCGIDRIVVRADLDSQTTAVLAEARDPSVNALEVHPWDRTAVFGNMLLYGTHQEKYSGLRIFDFAQKAYRIPNSEPLPMLETLRISPDGETVAAGALSGGLQFLDYRELLGRVVRNAHSDRITHLAYSPDGMIVASHSNDGTIRFWSPHSALSVGPILTDTDTIQDILFTQNGRHFVTSEGNGMLRVRDVSGFFPRATMINARSHIMDMDVHPDGRLVAIAREDGKISFHDVNHGVSVGPIVKLSRSAPAHFVKFSPDGRLVLYGGNDGNAHLFSMAEMRPIVSPMEHGHWTLNGVFHPDSQTFLVNRVDGYSQLWRTSGNPVDLPTQLWHTDVKKIGSPLLQPRESGGQREVWESAFVDGGRIAVTGDNSGTIGFWESATGQPVIPPASYGNNVQMIVANPRLPEIYAVVDGKVRTFTAADGTVRESATPWGDHVTRIVLDALGERLVACQRNRMVKIWNVIAHEEISAPLVHQTSVIHAAFHPVKPLLATVDSNSEVRFWDLQHYRSIGPPLQPPYHYKNLSNLETIIRFTPDGRKLILALNASLAVYDVPISADWTRDNALTRVRSMNASASESAPGPDHAADRPEDRNVRADWHRQRMSWAIGTDADFSALWHLARIERLGLAPEPETSDDGKFNFTANVGPDFLPSAAIPILQKIEIMRHKPDNPVPFASDMRIAEILRLLDRVSPLLSDNSFQNVLGDMIDEFVLQNRMDFAEAVFSKRKNDQFDNRSLVFYSTLLGLNAGWWKPEELSGNLDRLARSGLSFEEFSRMHFWLIKGRHWSEAVQFTNAVNITALSREGAFLWSSAIRNSVAARLDGDKPETLSYIQTVHKNADPRLADFLNGKMDFDHLLDALFIQVALRPSSPEPGLLAGMLPKYRKILNVNDPMDPRVWKSFFLESVFRCRAGDFAGAGDALKELSGRMPADFLPLLEVWELDLAMSSHGSIGKTSETAGLPDRLRQLRRGLENMKSVECFAIGELLLQEIAAGGKIPWDVGPGK